MSADAFRATTLTFFATLGVPATRGSLDPGYDEPAGVRGAATFKPGAEALGRRTERADGNLERVLGGVASEPRLSKREDA